MPLYEYQCQSCEKTFEYLQKFSDPPKKKCEACGKELKKAITRGGFSLKGKGWYKDGYSKDKAPSKDKTPSKEAPKCESCPAKTSCESPSAT